MAGKVTQRDKAIDVAKGWGILCIVFLHYEDGVLPSVLNVYIGLFMISIFYVTAGWIASGKPAMPTRELMRRRFRSLILPYLWWGLIIIAFDSVLWLFDYYDGRFMAREIYKTLTLRGIGTLWFLPALFIGEVLWNFCRRHSWPYTALIVVAVLCYQWGYDQVFRDAHSDMWMIINSPFRSVNNAAWAFLGVMCGFWAARLLKASRVTSPWIEGVAGLLLCGLGWFFTAYWQLPDPLGYIIFPLNISIISPIGFLLIFRAIGSHRVGEWLLKYFNFWGRNSLSLMVTHYSFVMVIVTIVFTQYIGIKLEGWPAIWAFLAMMPVQYIIARLLESYAPPAIMGKSGKRPAKDNFDKISEKPKNLRNLHD